MKLKFFCRRYSFAVLLPCLCLKTAHAEEVVAITYNGMATDSFQELKQTILWEQGNSNTGEYCCAGYVIKFYKELYGVDTYNINTVWGMPPLSKTDMMCALKKFPRQSPGI